MQSGSVLSDRGDITGAQLVLREGEMDSDMHSHHAWHCEAERRHGTLQGSFPLHSMLTPDSPNGTCM